MQRSSSLVNMMSSMTGGGTTTTTKLNDELPTRDPQSETTKKEIARDRLAASLVHLVPVVIILCAVLLWFFSYPEIRKALPGKMVIMSNETAFER